jgi:hypothetical protein
MYCGLILISLNQSNHPQICLTCRSRTLSETELAIATDPMSTNTPAEFKKENQPENPNLSTEDFKQIDLEEQTWIASLPLETKAQTILDRIHHSQRIMNIQKLRIGSLNRHLIDWHENASAIDRDKLRLHDLKYKVQTVSVSEKPPELNKTEKLIEKMMKNGFSRESAVEFIAKNVK